MTSAHQHRPRGRLTVDEWEKLPHDPDGPRVELIDGVLRVSPAPSYAHQAIGDELRTVLATALREHGRHDLRAGTAVGAKIATLHGYIPDVLVLRRQRDGTVAVVARDLVLAVEIVSPRSRKQDLMIKPTAYAEAGVPHFWRVEPSRGTPPTVHCFELDGDGTYVEQALAGLGEPPWSRSTVCRSGSIPTNSTLRSEPSVQIAQRMISSDTDNPGTVFPPSSRAVIRQPSPVATACTSVARGTPPPWPGTGGAGRPARSTSAGCTATTTPPPGSAARLRRSAP
ncbi:Uma2 family endonuclease [Longimycelium tulufanense]|uniref:Uma2 family endonuclease n=1 Tax=Longimycelium tulufanense TaxID=907463 RepID=UPI0016629227